ncbi:hypothetical protein ZIOFF_047453 [Zingiber officinale]|uniref:acyl-CoA oxidase n=1 Tax=Zingiber officinale TaxID=94328 RepID=A0A8J5G642_ZINOF|nr:hypothetical protein ZIOFF_047453 [Zingiber officinale]
MEASAVDHLATERKKAQFDVQAMKIAWAGSKNAFEVANRMAHIVASDPVIFLLLLFVFRKDNRTMLGRKELFKNTLKKSAHAWKRINELRLTEEEASMFRIFIDEPGYGDLHWGMFVPAIKGQGTEEQQKKWLPLAYKMQIIGCYAQTELGHGSNVQGLETTATFDPKTDEFVIHSPTLTSSKWWPGGLGKVSTHAVVYARLIIDGKDYGINGFIVQLRSLDDHSPLPGIVVGDIGMKFGNGAYNTMDNGVLQFDHVRIPRNQMLMRVSQVTKEGKYVQSDVPRQLLYGTMVYVRQTIVSDASKALSRAVCIAVRYSCVRRQFGSQDGSPETQVIDYKTQQSRLFPLLASAYAFRFVGQWLKWLYNDVTERLRANDFSTLPEAHACTAGLKSLTTSVTADGIEECRKLCGGHGYLCSSGLPELFAVYVPACTYEGDNIVLLLQVSSFLVSVQEFMNVKVDPLTLLKELINVVNAQYQNWDFNIYSINKSNGQLLVANGGIAEGLEITIVNVNDTSFIAIDGIEECRKLCGGHGYLCSSGLPELFAVYVPACTYEGDNIVLLLQVDPLTLLKELINVVNAQYQNWDFNIYSINKSNDQLLVANGGIAEGLEITIVNVNDTSFIAIVRTLNLYG